MSRAIERDSWQQDLQHLLQQGVLAGYALMIHQQRCETSHRLLSTAQESLAQQGFAYMFESEQQVEAVSILGHKAIVFKQGPCNIYAISRRRQLGVCINNLPFGVLVSVFQKPQLPQTVIPMLEKICSNFRA